MSASQVLTTVVAALTDEATGLAAKAEALKADGTLEAELPTLNRIRTDYRIVPHSLSDRMQPTGQPAVAVSVRRYMADQRLATAPTRDALAEMQVAVEYVEADQQVIEDSASLAATALLQVLDGLREYSDANGGTVLDLDTQGVGMQVDTQFGQFDGPVQSFGFVARFTVMERSAR